MAFFVYLVGRLRRLTRIYTTLRDITDGNAWSIIPSPNTTPALGHELLGIGCASPTFCWAVGDYARIHGPEKPLLELWDGVSWTISAPPATPGQAELHGVACATSSLCWAVGTGGPADGSVPNAPFVAEWDGVQWSEVAAPPSGFILDGVTCVTDTDCWAVGKGEAWVSSSSGSGHTTLVSVADHWNGQTWSADESPDLADGSGSILLSVTCAAANDCWAVGGGFAGATPTSRFEHWDGNMWQADGPTSDGFLSGVECSSSTDCWASAPSGDTQYDGTHPSPPGPAAAFHWDGATWSSGSASGSGSLTYTAGIACGSAAACFMVGLTGNPASTFIDRWDGTTWSPETSPNHEGAGLLSNSIAALSCVTASDCWATSTGGAGTPLAPAFQRWDGQSWSPVPSAPLASQYQGNGYDLGAVSCTTNGFCMAAGEIIGKGVSFTEEWNGSTWAMTSSPAEDASTGLSCLSSTDCWLVGGSDIQHWNGNAWVVSASVNPDGFGATLEGVTCAAATECWTTGSYITEAGYTGHWADEQPLIERWDGASWQSVPAPSPYVSNSVSLNSVTCTALDRCWAVGGTVDTDSNANPAGSYHPLIEEWDGTAWALQGVAGASTGDALTGVSCTSATACWAVGFEGSINGGERCAALDTCTLAGNLQGSLLTERWDGAGWTTWTATNAPGADLTLAAGVACVAGTTCFLGGYYQLPSDGPRIQQTLIEQFPLSVPPEAVSPATGTSLGGTTVNLTGAGLSGATSVSFGGTPGTDLHVIDDHTATVSAPPGSGTVNVTVTTPNGTSATSSSDQFTYVSPHDDTASVSSTHQFSLPSSDGATWQPLSCASPTVCSSGGSGSAVSMTLTPSASGVALITGNADLWTAEAGVNQDLGIVVSGGAYPSTGGQPEAWKESGGFAGTYSPNAATAQAAIPVVQGVTYTIDLAWKTNRPAPGATIYAGAGTASSGFSPTRLAAVVVPASEASVAVTTKQLSLPANDGTTWQPLDCTAAVTCSSTGHGSTSLTLTPQSDEEAVMSASADLWTGQGGLNQDLAIFVNGAPLAWKESGGFAGTFSPNAAYLHAVLDMSAGSTYHVSLAWKINKPGQAVFAGAGSATSGFSPTSLVVQTLPAGGNPATAVSTHQYSLTGSDGSSWVPLACAGSTSCSGGGTGATSLSITPSQTCTAVLRANADLWTESAGVNQDLAIFVNGVPLAWKESGGFAGTFSPNAAAVVATTSFTAGVSYAIDLRWKSNIPAPDSTIVAGAGPSGPYSPTSVSAELTNCS